MKVNRVKMDTMSEEPGENINYDIISDAFVVNHGSHGLFYYG